MNRRLQHELLAEFGKVEAASLVDMAPQFSASRTGDINENSSSSITGQSNAARVEGCEEEFLGART